MSNRFREHLDEEPELEEEIDVKVKSKPKRKEPESSNTFFKKLFTEGVVSKEAATEMLPFLIFLSVLCMLYIANSHMAVKNIRSIDKLNKEVKELSWEYKSLKADLMFKSKLTEVAKKVDTLGIKELTEPPKKIVINSNEY
ncbi:MAG: FtsL-like putative cell division protein [Candidatus Pedobacter colombiensis]|uniref:FtsL-like putative cell division protein n=1 Tax=Candidatus Pedobacter colombiensis TaxID=3121371 RepID=A0AAJ5W5L5_9SPHI|nr:FtsL-like putative cell division protein [Pedobacter sp.]WEK18444.1 MAG: FtsL-like putative cell division protein [Pedobacter sp.]